MAKDFEDVKGAYNHAREKIVNSLSKAKSDYHKSVRQRIERSAKEVMGTSETVDRDADSLRAKIREGARQIQQRRDDAEWTKKRNSRPSTPSVSDEISRAYHADTTSGRIARGILTGGASEIMEAQKRKREENRRNGA